MRAAPTSEPMPVVFVVIPTSKSPVSSNSSTSVSHLQFLGWLNSYESFIEQQIVDDFQCAGDEEWRIDPRRPGKHKSHEQGTDGSAHRARHASDSSRRRPFIRTHHCHGVGLSRRNIHLADTKSHQENQNR